MVERERIATSIENGFHLVGERGDRASLKRFSNRLRGIDRIADDDT